MMNLEWPRPMLRGAKMSPMRKIAAQYPHLAGPTPKSFGMIPKKLQMWGNERDGDCVSAEEAAAIAMWSIRDGGTELLVTDSDLVSWARQHGFLNGADLMSVLELRRTSPLPAGNFSLLDGPAQSVDWTNRTVLASAIYQGPVKIAVAADQLQSEFQSTKGQSGWFGANFKTDVNYDHCVNLCAFGTAQECADMLTATWPDLSISIPSDEHGTESYGMFSWMTIGIVPRTSMIAITGEAHLRTPTNIGGPLPTPKPSPTPEPKPTPKPIPVPPGPEPAATLIKEIFAFIKAFLPFSLKRFGVTTSQIQNVVAAIDQTEAFVLSLYGAGIHGTGSKYEMASITLSIDQIEAVLVAIEKFLPSALVVSGLSPDVVTAVMSAIVWMLPYVLKFFGG